MANYIHKLALLKYTLLYTYMYLSCSKMYLPKNKQMAPSIKVSSFPTCCLNIKIIITI